VSDLAEVLIIVMTGLVVLIPVAGLTANFLYKQRKPPPDLTRIQQQVALLREQQEGLAAELHNLKEAQEFQAKLLENPPDKETE